MPQRIISGDLGIKEFQKVLTSINSKRFMLVCGNSFWSLPISDQIINAGVPFVSFSDITPNPLYEQVAAGVEVFLSEGCDAIVAVGGGSIIDVAKCIKLYCRMSPDKNYLLQEYTDSGVPIIAVPTTAGTGSESTRFAVIYFEGKKQSVAHDSILPDFVFLEPKVLKSLPVYQKKCTLLDALCQAIESWWSVNSTDESKSYSKLAIETIMANYKEYIFDNGEFAAEQIMQASNLAGQAINITKTTAAHAMSYKISALYNIPHGYAVAVCLPEIWRYMCDNIGKCIERRGGEYLKGVFSDIAAALGAPDANSAIDVFVALMDELALPAPSADSDGTIAVLVESVNADRLKNNPVALDEAALGLLYSRILGK